MPLQPLGSSRAPLRGYAPKTHSAFPYPAPTKGLDYLHPLSTAPEDSALVASNVICRPYGVEFRAGWRRWSSNIPGEVRTIMPFNPPRGQAALQGKIFAACSNGKIYDVTLQTNEATTPPVSVTIPGQNEPGEFSWTNFATASVNYLCIVSAGGGYWTYDAVGGWVNRTSAISGGGGPNAINFDFVMSWKNRLWFVVDQTADTYFLAVNAISGASTNFDFGPLFVNGGDIKAMASWTVDAGSGLDDKLVIVSGSGDLLIYEGTDPTSAATFRVAGRWYVGPVPNGRRFLDRYGGDLAMVTQYGVLYLSKILQQRSGAEDPLVSATYTINPFLGSFVRATVLEQYWEVRWVPALQLLFLNAPDGVEIKDRQFVLDVVTGGWSTFDGIPMLTCETFQNDFYFGTKDGIIGKAFQPEVQSDGLLTDGTAGKDILIQVQTAFVPGGDPIRWKRMLQALLTFQGAVPPDIKAQINVDWDFTATPGAPIFLGSKLPLWDVALWDQAIWLGGLQNTSRAWIGALGIGYFGCLRFSGKGAPGTLFMNWLLVTEGGGIM